MGTCPSAAAGQQCACGTVAQARPACYFYHSKGDFEDKLPVVHLVITKLILISTILAILCKLRHCCTGLYIVQPSAC